MTGFVKTKGVQYGKSTTATDNFVIQQPTSPDGSLRISNGNIGATTDLVAVTSAGNVGIGTSSPQVGLQVNSSGNNSLLKLTGASSGTGLNDGLDVGINSLDAIVWNRENGSLQFATNNTERMRIDSAGNLLVNRTTASIGGSSARFFVDGDSSAEWVASFNNQRSDNINSSFIFFGRRGSGTGTISNTNTNTSYNTSSDYRLKENVEPMAGALEKVQALNPVTWSWKADGAPGQGFIAHELAEVCPDAVSGEKDAVDEDGNPQYQGVDTSFLVGILTKAIQELNAKVDAQAAEIAELKGQ